MTSSRSFRSAAATWFARLAAARPRLRLAAPVTFLLALLQRAPADRVVLATEEFVAASPVGALLRAATVAAASLGGLHSLAGATTLVATTPSPVNAKVGDSIQVGFTVTDTINIGSWKIGGTLPPGLAFSAMEGGNTLTGPGTLDATTEGVSDGYGGTTGGVATTTPLLTGKPTQAGTYTFTLQAFELGKLSGLSSNTFNYTITVAGATASGSAPTFTTQPTARSATAGTSVTFTVAVDGSPAPTLQWQKNGTPLAGQTSATLTLSNVQSSDAGTYTAVATNATGTVTSSAAALTVTPVSTGSVPTIARQPSTQTIATGTTAVLSADVTGQQTLQWRKNNVAIPGATNAMLVISAAATGDGGSYSLLATNSAGTTTSATANLNVTPTAASDVGRLVNLAIRTNAGTGAQTLIVGFAVGGNGTTGTKPLLVRAVGPTLTQFGLTGVLADPVATIFQGTTTVATNDNWGGDAGVLSRATQVGAFGLSSNTSLDAALAFTPAAGSYTLQVTGQNNGTGIALAEIYDATPNGTATAATPRLVNVSARTQVGTGSDILIAGFVVGGTTARTVLIRAIGPTLGSFGVSGSLADPKLQLYSGSNLLQENDNWGGDAQLTSVGTSVGAFSLSDPNSKDSMMLVTLAPGLYTAQVSGVGGTSGVALIELYEVP